MNKKEKQKIKDLIDEFKDFLEDDKERLREDYNYSVDDLRQVNITRKFFKSETNEEQLLGLIYLREKFINFLQELENMKND